MSCRAGLTAPILYLIQTEGCAALELHSGAGVLRGGPRTIRGVDPGLGLWALGPGESHTFIHPFSYLVFLTLWEGAGLPSGDSQDEGSQSSPLKLTFQTSKNQCPRICTLWSPLCVFTSGGCSVEEKCRLVHRPWGGVDSSSDQGHAARSTGHSKSGCGTDQAGGQA